MNSIIENEAVQRVQKALSIFDNNIKISILEKTAKTAKEAAIAFVAASENSGPPSSDRFL